MRIGLRGDMVICIDLDSWGRRGITSDIDSSNCLGNVYHFRDLTLSILEIIDRDDGVLALVVLVVGKRVVQLVVRMSNGASAEED